MTSLITQNSLLLTKLLEFYNKDGNMERILPIINGESIISLRLIDWFATNYSKKHYTVYPLKMKNGDEKRFKVYIDYKLKLKAYSKDSIHFVDGIELQYLINRIHIFKLQLDN